MNSTTTYRVPILSQRPGIHEGRWCVEGHRIQRSDVRDYVRLLGKPWVMAEVYPQLTEEEIDFCMARRREMTKIT